eukprot:284819399_2
MTELGIVGVLKVSATTAVFVDGVCRDANSSREAVEEVFKHFSCDSGIVSWPWSCFDDGTGHCRLSLKGFRNYLSISLRWRLSRQFLTRGGRGGLALQLRQWNSQLAVELLRRNWALSAESRFPQLLEHKSSLMAFVVTPIPHARRRRSLSTSAATVESAGRGAASMTELGIVGVLKVSATTAVFVDGVCRDANSSREAVEEVFKHFSCDSGIVSWPWSCFDDGTGHCRLSLKGFRNYLSISLRWRLSRQFLTRGGRGGL